MIQSTFLKQAEEKFNRLEWPMHAYPAIAQQFGMEIFEREKQITAFLTSLIQERDRQWSEALTDIFRKENPYLWNAFVISDSEGWKAAVRNMNKIIKQMV